MYERVLTQKEQVCYSKLQLTEDEAIMKMHQQIKIVIPEIGTFSAITSKA